MDSEREFAFHDEEGRALRPGPAEHASCTGACPLAQIPAEVWQRLLRPTFRKRHPILFWAACILGMLLVFGILFSLSSDDELMGTERIALIKVSGPIIKADPILAWIHKVAQSPTVKGALVRVDSPGGGAAASQEIHDALAMLAQKMPVAISMGGVAASGGLMISMAGTRIFANPSTVTGSIGVRMDIPQLQGLLHKIGVDRETLTTAPYKDAGSYMRPLTQEQRAYFQAVLEDMHQQFVDLVAKGRGMERQQAAQLADGKIYTGREAHKNGLVDELGGQEAALKWLAQKSGVPANRKLLEQPKEGDWFSRVLKTCLGLEYLDLTALKGQGETPVFLYQL
jgi:protease-4